MLSKALVVGAYQKKAEELAALPGVELTVAVPPVWREPGALAQELGQALVIRRYLRVGKAFFKGMARAQISAEPVGMLKILFHRETLEILGVHCFGYQASEIVHIGQAIMNQKGEANTLKYFVNTTFNYPTMAEAYRVAAFDGLNRLF